MEGLHNDGFIIKDYVQTLPECINDFFLWQADVWIKQADRDRERNYTISDLTLQFMNEMLPAIREVIHEVRLAFLTYLEFGEIIKDDINYYRNLGISTITTFAVGIDKSYLAEFTSPAIFQYASLLWDSQTDLQSQLEDFCEHFYDDKDLANIFQLCEQLEPIDPMPQSWQEYIDELGHARSRIQQILNAKTDENIRVRLQRLHNEIDHVCFVLNLIRALSNKY